MTKKKKTPSINAQADKIDNRSKMVAKRKPDCDSATQWVNQLKKMPIQK